MDYLNSTQSLNIKILFAYCIKEKTKNCELNSCIKVDTITNSYRIECIRKLSIEQLKTFNRQFKCDVRNKYIRYMLLVNKERCELSCNPVEFDQLSLLNNHDEIILNKYNNKITNRLMKVKELLIETLYPSQMVKSNWIYFFESKNYVGFANADLNNKHCLKGSFNNIPKNVWTYYGTYNDANCIRLRKIINSNFNTNWLMAPRDIKDLNAYKAN